MHASKLVSVLAFCALGCGASVQPGWANAPVLGGATPETRVHDAIANGHDACERAMFPQGEVLRGQVPPCGNESRSKTSGFKPNPGTSLSGPHAAEFCPPVRRSANSGVAAFQLSGDPWWLPCDKRWRGDRADTAPSGPPDDASAR